MNDEVTTMQVLEDSEALDGLSTRQTVAMGALLEGATHAEAAEKAGVVQSTVTRWVRYDPQFKAVFRAAKRATLEEGIGALQALMIDAVDALKRNLRSGIPGVESRTALGIIDRAFKGAEIGDLTAMLEQLEQQDGDSDY